MARTLAHHPDRCEGPKAVVTPWAGRGRAGVRCSTSDPTNGPSKGCTGPIPADALFEFTNPEPGQKRKIRSKPLSEPRRNSRVSPLAATASRGKKAAIPNGPPERR